MGKNSENSWVKNLSFVDNIGSDSVRNGDKAFRVFATQNTSRDFVKSVIAALSSLPKPVLRDFNASAVQVFLGLTPVDLGRSSYKSCARDFCHRSDVEIGGWFFSILNTICMSQKIFSQNSNCFVDNLDIEHTAIHEAMHAYDYLNGLSICEGFKRAYQLDRLAGLLNQKENGYQLQEGRRGLEEAFAESGCFALGIPTLCMEKWHNTNSYVAAFFASLIDHYQDGPDYNNYEGFKRAQRDAEAGCLREVLNRGSHLLEVLSNAQSLPQFAAALRKPIKSPYRGVGSEVNANNAYTLEEKAIIWEMIESQGAEKSREMVLSAKHEKDFSHQGIRLWKDGMMAFHWPRP